VASKNDTTSQATPNTAVSDVDALKTQIQDLQAQVAERDTHIRELEMENIKYVDPFFLSLSLSFFHTDTLFCRLRVNQQRVRDVLLTST